VPILLPSIVDGNAHERVAGLIKKAENWDSDERQRLGNGMTARWREPCRRLQPRPSLEDFHHLVGKDAIQTVVEAGVGILAK